MRATVNVISFIMAFIGALSAACIESPENTAFIIGILSAVGWFCLRLYCTHLYLRRRYGRK